MLKSYCWQVILLLFPTFFLSCNKQKYKESYIDKSSYSLSIKIGDYKNQKIYLSTFYGHQLSTIDSTTTDKEGKALFTLKNNNYRGFYRIIPFKPISEKEDEVIDILFNNEDIELSTTFSNAIADMQVIQSFENSIYYEYLKYKTDYSLKEKVLLGFLTLYPKNDEWHSKTENYFNSLIIAYDDFVDHLVETYPNSIAVKFIKAERKVKAPKNLDASLYVSYMKEHYLDNIDFKDSTLLYYQLLPDVISEYYSFFESDEIDDSAAWKNRFEFIEKINQKTIVNTAIHQNMMEYLAIAFNKMGYDTLVLYIYDNYLAAETCEETSTIAKLKRRVEGIKAIKVGTKSIDFSFIDYFSKQHYTLYNINADYRLLLFWSSKCSHCLQLMDSMNDFLLKIKQKSLHIEIIAISLDLNKQDYEKYLENNKINAIHYCDFKGYESEIARKYYVSATPTMIVIDKNHLIVAKPKNINELKIYFKI